MLDLDNNFYLISLSILIPCWLDNVWILPREVTLQSIVEFKELIVYSVNSEYNWIVDVPPVWLKSNDDQITTIFKVT